MPGMLKTYSTVFVLLIISVSNEILPQEPVQNNYRVIYLVNNRWHTGIVLALDSTVIKLVGPLRNFQGYYFADIGWGDEDFYQSTTDFNFLLALKAILIPTGSVIRIAGYKADIKLIISLSQICVKLILSEMQFEKLCEFIDLSFERGIKDSFIITSKSLDRSIIFYKARYKYHLLNTCNTWMANALATAGLEINPSEIITTDELFKVLIQLGEVLKNER